MNKVNLLYRAGESINGYQNRIVNRLLESELINKIIVVSRSGDIPKVKDNVVEYPSAIGWKYMYEYMPEFKIAKPFSRKMLEVIKKYEPMALSISRRDTNFDIYTVEEARRIYYIALKYWYGVIIKHKINYMCFAYVPHTTHEYAIYVLGKALQIPMLLFSVTTIPNVYAYGDSIHTIGENIRKDYLLSEYYKNNGNLSNVFIKRYLDRMLYNHKEIKFDLIDNKEKSTKKVKTEYFRYINPINICVKIAYHFKCFMLRDYRDVEFRKKEIRDTIRAYNAYFHQKKIKYYEKMSSVPDYKRPYIYYALHMQPEATTTPGAGVFENQLFAIELLAAAAKTNGMVVYIKEHYSQLTRDKEFYSDLRKIQNVVWITSGESSLNLINNAVAVASQTGSCIIEGALKKKPVLVFGDNYYWKGLPGAYEINNYKQCRDILKEIKCGNVPKITDQDLLEYFYVVDKNTIKDYSFFPKKEELDILLLDEVVENKCKIILNNISEANLKIKN